MFNITVYEEVKIKKTKKNFFAKSKGYEDTVIKGYIFNKVENIFNDYINDLYN
jgi:hypothetical protein